MRTTFQDGPAKVTLHKTGSAAESFRSLLEMCLSDPQSVHVLPDPRDMDAEPLFVWEPDDADACELFLRSVIAQLEGGSHGKN